MITPDEKHKTMYKSSQGVKDMVYKVLKPSDCALKIKKIIKVRNNGILIKALSPDVDKIKAHQNLSKARLRVTEKIEENPKLIVYGVSADMTFEEIKEELVDQNLNLKEDYDGKLKVIYIYKPKDNNKRYTRCVIKVGPKLREQLLKNGKIYLRYSVCKSADYINVLQCYRCMLFGHTAKNCMSNPVCGFCSKQHEMRECVDKVRALVCCNCIRNNKLERSIRYMLQRMLGNARY